jgi:ABC-type lipoprotein release transport system permease subunit
MGSIVLGVWGLIFMIAFYNSFTKGFAQNAIKYEHSHLQVHHPDYITDPVLVNSLSASQNIIEEVSGNESVDAFSARKKVNAMIGSAKTSAGIQIYGIEPDLEAKTTYLEDLLVEGTYFEKIKRNPILISTKLAEKLKVKVRSKVVLTFQDQNSDITAASFRIEGIFKSKSPRINEGVVYVRISDINRLVGDERLHEIGIRIQNPDQLIAYQAHLDQLSDDTIRTYKEVAPEFTLMEESSNMTKQVLTVIVMLALLFGIVNTMLMAVLERTREIGMLRSVGMHRKSIFSMIVMETLILSVLSGPVGLVLGFLTVMYLNTNGVDFSRYADALSEYGYDAIFYPTMENYTYFVLMGIVLITAFIGAIYPAIKAISINPLEAIRKL